MSGAEYIPVNIPLLNGNEKKYLSECIDTGWISSEGPFVERFEKMFSKKIGRKHGIAVTNGTAAIDAAIDSLGIAEGDEVIMPAFTIISCVLQIVRASAVPVLVDCDPVTFNMDISQIEAKITPRTKAIMVVHIYGLPVEMNAVLALAKKYDLFIIEDTSEVIGLTYHGKPCGSFGDISTFSFYPNKHITTGEGGMIATDDDQLAAVCRSLRNLCFQPKKRFVHERLGWNLRMTNIQAAIGVAQLERLDEFVEHKRSTGRRYNELFAGLPNVQLPLEKTDAAENIYWVYSLVLDESKGINAEDAMQKLAEKGIGCRPFFCPLHQQPVLLAMGLFKNEVYPVAERLYRQGFYIPSGMGLKSEQINLVANAVWDVLG
jgi:perosamine synthetase